MCMHAFYLKVQCGLHQCTPVIAIAVQFCTMANLQRRFYFHISYIQVEKQKRYLKGIVANGSKFSTQGSTLPLATFPMQQTLLLK